MLVINKPRGLPVHAGPSGGDNLENYFDALRFGLPRKPALAHRLDRDTSGCLALGRHPKALRKLGKLFQSGRVEKTYWAICKGVPDALSGSILFPLEKTPRGSGWRVEISDAGKEARTTYRVLAQKDGFSVIAAKPRTGRTHQIRVHLTAIGAPILGDAFYDPDHDSREPAPLMLHARRLVIPLSATKAPVEVDAPPTIEMAALLQKLAPNIIDDGRERPVA